MATPQRDCRVYYAECPEDSDHFILIDPSDPVRGNAPPLRSPTKEKCRGCGPNYEVSIKADWRVGYASREELDQGFAYSEPAEQSEAPVENAATECP